MSIEALNWALKQEIRPATKKFVLVVLANYASEWGKSFPSTETLCNRTCLNRKTVIASLDALEKDGSITDTGQRVGTTKQIKVYLINSPENGTLQSIPKTESKAPENGRKDSQKRDTEPKVTKVESKDSPQSKKEAEEIYELYPRKVGKPVAVKAIAKQIKVHGYDHVKTRTGEFAAAWEGGDLTYCPHPATWFNQQRFNDKPDEWIRQKREKSRETVAKEGGATPSGPQDF